MNSRVTDAATTAAIVADDLIWSSRLRAAVERAGGRPVAVRADELRSRSDALVIIDLTSRTYDGVAAVAAAAGTGATVIAVGQHEDLDLRKRALAAGAERVYSYNKIFSDGPQVLSRWLDRSKSKEDE